MQAAYSVFRVQVPQKRAHRTEEGFEKCKHTCQEDGCRNRTGSIWWKREGSSCGRHCVSTRAHPKCSPQCPGYKYLGGRLGRPTVASKSKTLLLRNPEWVLPVVTPRQKLEKQPIIVFVQDKTRQTTYEKAASTDLNFTEINSRQSAEFAFAAHPIPLECERLEKAFPGFIWKTVRDGLQSITYLDWLQVPARLRVTHSAEVVLIDHDRFLKCIDVQLDNPDGANVLRADLIVGGIDYTIDWMNQYGMSHQQLKRYEDIIGRLQASGTRFWPPPFQSRLYGQKKPLILHLDCIAARRGEKRPHTTIIPECLPRSTLSDYVFKRGYSDCGNHVILPKDRSAMNWEEIQSERLDWMAQEYVETLQTYGELRVLCINGEPVDIVRTMPNTDDGEDGSAPYHCVQVTTIAPLEMLDFIGREYGPYRIVNGDGESYSIEQGMQGTDSFKCWVTKVLHELIAEEEAQNRWRSSLRDMCRVDVGFIRDETNHLQPFFHEVERERNTTFFSSVLEPHRANGVWAALSQVIYNLAHASSEV